MKIDLHVHTKKIAQGDPITRNIESKDFRNKMIESGVGIVAITNHYEFDMKQYNEFKDYDGRYIILPGVELDVLSPSDYKVQANIIAHPNDADLLEEELKKINNQFNRIKYKDLLNKFDKEKWIIYLDYKNSGNTSWTPNDMIKAISDFKHSLVITDTNKATTLQVLNSNNFKALIGSDVMDWKQYVSESNKLLFTNFKIESYNIFWSVLKNNLIDSSTIFSKISTKTFNDLKMDGSNSNGDYTVNGITIKDGVNIFMGPKRTGKSMILKKIHKREKNSIYYESSNKEQNIENLKKTLLNKDIFNDHKLEINAILKELLDYEDVKFNKFHDFYKHVYSKTKVSFHNKWNINSIDNIQSEEQKREIELLKQASGSLKSIYVDLQELNISCDDWLEKSEFILNELWEKLKNIYKNTWKNNFKKSIKEGIDELLKKNNGTFSKPISVGFLDRYNAKRNFKINLEKLINLQVILSKNIKEYNVPKRTAVHAKQNIIIPNIKKCDNYTKFKGKKRKIELIIKSIKQYEKAPFSVNITEVVKSLKEFKQDNEYWVEEVIISDSSGNESFSNGEKAHMLLDEELSKDVEYYILDEPSVFLSRESIIDFLLPKISDLVKFGKRIIIATHNSSMGLNTIPINYIYRKYNNRDECDTYIGSVWERKFVNVKNNNDTLTFANEIMGNFEGSAEHFEFRKEIYERN